MPAAKRFRILAAHVSYPDGKGGEKMAHAGDVADDLPKQSIGWLEEQGHIEQTSDPVGSTESGAQ